MWQYRNPIMPLLLALASLGSLTQMGLFLFVLCGQGKFDRHFRDIKPLPVSLTNFANRNKYCSKGVQAGRAGGGLAGRETDSQRRPLKFKV
jgi:hypothetical protein